MIDEIDRLLSSFSYAGKMAEQDPRMSNHLLFYAVYESDC